MKLQSQVSRKVGDTEYTKFWVVIPKTILKKLNWKSGQELAANIESDKLVMEEKKNVLVSN